MLCFVKLSEDLGTWANRDKALEFMSLGYGIFSDETMETKVSRKELEEDRQTENAAAQAVSETSVIMREAK